MKDSTKAYLVFTAVLLALVAGAIVLAAKKSGSGTPKVTPESSLQAYVTANATGKVAGVAVSSCNDAGAQTVGGVNYAKVYACPTLVSMKDGSQGCVGILFTYTSDRSVAVVAAPTAIDAQYCKAAA